jgi:EAL and modified HD-GYP domain-containing signal transduction protein
MIDCQPDTVLDVFVARQPIFSRNLQVYGYELLYRGTPGNSFDGTSADVATARVIANTFLTIGGEKLLDGKIPFINFDSSLLLKYAALLPFPSAVVEILENVEATDDVLAACQDLKNKGHQLALDDVESESRIEPWRDIVDIVKVDFLKAGTQARKDIVAKCKKHKIHALAEKLETKAEFDEAVALGYEYFQGFFFARPTMVKGQAMSEAKLVLIQLMREVNADEVDFDRIEQLIQRNVSLVYKLLRFVNSPLFAWHSHIKSVRHATTLLGEAELRKWICLLLVAGLGSDADPQVLVDSLVRARFAELLCPKVRLSQKKASAFLLGLLSHLDVLLHRPMEDVITELDLDEDLANALLGRNNGHNPLSLLYELMQAYDKPDWIRATAIAQEFHVGMAALSTAYVQAVEWADVAAKA